MTHYGFVDAFNPNNGWVNPDVIGIDWASLSSALKTCEPETSGDGLCATRRFHEPCG